MVSFVLVSMAMQGTPDAEQRFGVADLGTFLSFRGPTLVATADGDGGYVGVGNTTDGLRVTLTFEKKRLDPGYRSQTSATDYEKRILNEYAVTPQVGETHASEDGATIRSYRMRDSVRRSGMLLLRYPVGATLMVDGPDTDAVRERITAILSSARVYAYRTGGLEPVLSASQAYPWEWPGSGVRFNSLYEPPMPTTSNDTVSSVSHSGWGLRYPGLSFTVSVRELDPWEWKDAKAVFAAGWPRPVAGNVATPFDQDLVTFGNKPFLRTQAVLGGPRSVRLLREEGTKLLLADFEVADDPKGRQALKDFLGVSETPAGAVDVDKVILPPSGEDRYEVVERPAGDPKLSMALFGFQHPTDWGIAGTSDVLTTNLAPLVTYASGESVDDSATSPNPKIVKIADPGDEFVRNVESVAGHRLVYLRARHGGKIDEIFDFRDLGLGTAKIQWDPNVSNSRRRASRALKTLRYRLDGAWHDIDIDRNCVWTWREEPTIAVSHSSLPLGYAKNWVEEGIERHRVFFERGDARLAFTHWPKWPYEGKKATDHVSYAFRPRPTLNWYDGTEGHALEKMRPTTVMWRGRQWACWSGEYVMDKPTDGAPSGQKRFAVVLARREGKTVWSIQGDCVLTDVAEWMKGFRDRLAIDFPISTPEEK